MSDAITALDIEAVDRPESGSGILDLTYQEAGPWMWLARAAERGDSDAVVHLFSLDSDSQLLVAPADRAVLGFDRTVFVDVQVANLTFPPSRRSPARATSSTWRT